ncbi:hypothetical protein FA95DRAFT_1566959 [Auriscalpium vulgare]|uniref:Uncharacterized protein n=1 Tax=Auriscalpium vulgare TaxID=40419 RepID=A0ACB8R6I8_9AGAM|nr:hypothetical protein FA95DRAFT_1566959 [Auriscalpium vulgare]
MSQQPSDHSSGNNYGQQTQPEVSFAGSHRPFSPVRDSILNSSSANIMRNDGRSIQNQSLGGVGWNIGSEHDGGVVTNRPDVPTRTAHMPNYGTANLSASSQVQCADPVLPAAQFTPGAVYRTMPGSTPAQAWSTPAPTASNDTVVARSSTGTASGGPQPFSLHPASWGVARQQDPRCAPAQGGVRYTMAPPAEGTADPPQVQPSHRFAYGRPVQFQPRPVQQRARGRDRANGGKDSPRDWMDVMKSNGGGRK